MVCNEIYSGVLPPTESLGLLNTLKTVMLFKCFVIVVVVVVIVVVVVVVITLR